MRGDDQNTERAAAEPAARRSPTFAKTGLVAFALAGILLGFYRGALDVYFFHDDFVFLDRATLAAPSDLVASFSLERNQRGLHEKSHSYRPVSTNLYFGAVRSAFGLSPRAFHATNLLALAGIATLLVVLLAQLGLPPAGGAALALIFALSAINFETQLWISVFQELAFALLALAAVIVHIASERSSRKRAAAVTGLYLLALLCKEMAISLPAILLGFELLVRRARLRDAVGATLPLWIATAVYATLRFAFIPVAFEGPYALRIGWFALGSFGTYVRWSVQALCLSADWRVLLALLALAGAGLRFASGRRRRLAAFGALWFAIALGPVLFLPNHLYRYYLVFPALGLMTAAAALVPPLAPRTRHGKLRAGLALALVLGFAAVSQQRFDAALARRERQTGRSQAILEQLRALHPVLPDHTQIYLSAPGNFAIARFLKDSGAAIRVIYGNPTLRADPLTPRAARRIGSGRDEPALAFFFGEDGRLREHPNNRRARGE